MLDVSLLAMIDAHIETAYIDMKIGDSIISLYTTLGITKDAWQRF